MSARNLRAAADRILSQAQNFAATSLPTTGEIPGILSDYARQYRDWLGRGGGAQNLQALGSRMFSPEAVRYVTYGGQRPAFASNDPDRVLGNVMDLISPAAKVGGLLGMLAGPGAKTANPRARALAEAMKGRGLSDEQIWEATGKQFGQPWWLGHPDRVPRFEISDEAFKYTPEGLPQQTSQGRRWGAGPTGQAMEHQGLFEAYPDIADIHHVRYPWATGELGRYRPPERFTDESITVFDRPAAVMDAPTPGSTALHEMQHAIQTREGMMGGGSPGQFRVNEAGLREMRDDMQIALQAQRLQGILSEAGGDMSKASGLFEQRFGAKPSNAVMNRAEFYSPEHLQSETAGLLQRLSDPTGMQTYKRLGGEMDARAVQARMNMPMSERISRPFWRDYDVPLSEMVVR